MLEQLIGDGVFYGMTTVVYVKPKPRVDVWTDGACSVHKNKRAGYAAILRFEKDGVVHRKIVRGGFDNGTNNRAECVAVLEALKVLKVSSHIVFHSDSKDVIGWLFGWNTITNQPDIKKRWKRKNVEIAWICAEIDQLIYENNHQVEFEWVRGHSGDSANEEVDVIAQEEARR